MELALYEQLSVYVCVDVCVCACISVGLFKCFTGLIAGGWIHLRDPKIKIQIKKGKRL